MKTEQLYDGVGVELESGKPFEFICCHCKLTHRVVIVTADGNSFGFAVKQDQARTVELRAATPPAVSPSGDL